MRQAIRLINSLAVRRALPLAAPSSLPSASARPPGPPLPPPTSSTQPPTSASPPHTGADCSLRGAIMDAAVPNSVIVPPSSSSRKAWNIGGANDISPVCAPPVGFTAMNPGPSSPAGVLRIRLGQRSPPAEATRCRHLAAESDNFDGSHARLAGSRNGVTFGILGPNGAVPRVGENRTELIHSAGQPACSRIDRLRLREPSLRRRDCCGPYEAPVASSAAGGRGQRPWFRVSADGLSCSLGESGGYGEARPGLLVRLRELRRCPLAVGGRACPGPEAAMCPFALEGLAQAVRVGRGGSKRRPDSWAPQMGLGVSAQTNSAAAGRRSGAAGGHPVRAARGSHGLTKEPLPSSGPRFCPEHRWPTSCPPRGRAAQFVIGPPSRRRSAPAAPKRLAKLAATFSAAETHAKAPGAVLFPKHDSLAGGPPETGAPPW